MTHGMEYQTKSPNLVAQKSRMVTFEYDQDKRQRKILTKIFTFALPLNFRSSPVTLHSEIMI